MNLENLKVFFGSQGLEDTAYTIDKYNLPLNAESTEQDLYNLYKFIESVLDNKNDVRCLALNIADLVEKKNSDYGNTFDNSLNTYGPVAYFLRIDDKLNRLKTLQNKKAEVEESKIDTVTDIIGYSLLYLLWLRFNERK